MTINRVQFFDLNLPKHLLSIPVGKISEMGCTFLCLEQYYLPDLNIERVIAGDNLGILHVYDLQQDWHICNDVSYKIKGMNYLIVFRI